MTFVVHIGSHKTGTTAIQRFAARHRKELRRQGLWYPSYADIGVREHYGHHHFAHAIAGEGHERFTGDDAFRFARWIRAGRRRGETVLLSSEPIYRHTLGQAGDYWSRRRAYIREFARILGTDEVKIVAVLRRQDGFARSLYQEQIKATKYIGDFRRFLSDKAGQFEYYRQLSLVREAFANVEVLVYEEMRQKGLVETFFRLLGVDISAMAEPSAVNTSLPIELVEYKRLLNATPLDKERLKRIAEKLARHANGRVADKADNVDWLPAAEMAAFVDSFADGNERVRRDFAQGHPVPLFPPLSADRPGACEYQGMSVERFAELTSEIFLGRGRRRRE